MLYQTVVPPILIATAVIVNLDVEQCEYRDVVQHIESVSSTQNSVFELQRSEV